MIFLSSSFFSHLAYSCYNSISHHITWHHSHTNTQRHSRTDTPQSPVSEIDLSLIYPCPCSFCVFSVQTSKCQAVCWWRAPFSRPALFHPMPATLSALPVVNLGSLPTLQLQRTTGEERYDDVKHSTWSVIFHKECNCNWIMLTVDIMRIRS